MQEFICPLQDEIFPDKEHFGRIFRNNAQNEQHGNYANISHYG
jgi:hypothetical protein